MLVSSHHGLWRRQILESVCGGGSCSSPCCTSPEGRGVGCNLGNEGHRARLMDPRCGENAGLWTALHRRSPKATMCLQGQHVRPDDDGCLWRACRSPSGKLSHTLAERPRPGATIVGSLGTPCTSARSSTARSTAMWITVSPPRRWLIFL